MQEAVLYLYGRSTPEHSSKLLQEDMFDNRRMLQRELGEGNDPLGLHIGYVVDHPTGEDIKPERVLINHNPVFDRTGKLLDIAPDNFQLGDIADYPVIVDHWVPQFRYLKQTEHGTEEIAGGLGLEAGRLINARTVQQYGNEKDRAERDILEPCGVALESFGTSPEELEHMGDIWGNGAVIFKPKAGALSKGIEIRESLQEMKTDIVEKRVPRTGIVQPFVDLREPLPNLKPLVPEYQEQLNKDNGKPDRVREVRLHFFVTTENNVREVHAYPTLRASQAGTRIMKNWRYTPLDPESFQQNYPHTVENTKKVAGRLATMADVPHLYGVTDVALGRHERRDGLIEFVGDLNCRGPRLPDASLPGQEIITPAQKEFIRMQKTMARIVLNAT